MSDLQHVLSFVALISCCILKPVTNFREPVHLVFGFQLLLLVSTFLVLLSFLGNLAFSQYAQSRTISVSTFLPPEMVQAWFDLGPPCLYGSPGYLQSSPPAPHFKQNNKSIFIFCQKPPILCRLLQTAQMASRLMVQEISN